MSIKILNLKNRVMARVYIEYTKEFLLTHFGYVVLMVLILDFIITVSIRDVIKNMPLTNFKSFVGFIIIAIRDTNIILKSIGATLVLRIIFLTYKKTHDVIKNVHYQKFLPIKIRY